MYSNISYSLGIIQNRSSALGQGCPAGGPHGLHVACKRLTCSFQDPTWLLQPLAMAAASATVVGLPFPPLVCAAWPRPRRQHVTIQPECPCGTVLQRCPQRSAGKVGHCAALGMAGEGACPHPHSEAGWGSTCPHTCMVCSLVKEIWPFLVQPLATEKLESPALGLYALVHRRKPQPHV